MRDEDVRASCFGQLAVMCAQFGEDVPYRGGLDAGFAFRGRRVPYLSPQKGIFRAAVQRGPAALSIQTSANSPYRDVETPDGFLYDYRAGAVDQPDNRALRAANQLQVPLVYFVGTRPGWYRPSYPFFIIGDDPAAKQVLVAPGTMTGPVDELEPTLPEDPIERRYAVREVRVRIHQRVSRPRRACLPRAVRGLSAKGGPPARCRPHRQRRRRTWRSRREQRTRVVLNPPSRIRPRPRRRVT